METNMSDHLPGVRPVVRLAAVIATALACAAAPAGASAFDHPFIGLELAH